MSLKDKIKNFYNSPLGNIFALILGIIALIIAFIAFVERTEASTLVVENDFDYPEFSEEFKSYITDNSEVVVYSYVGSNDVLTYGACIFQFDSVTDRTLYYEDGTLYFNSNFLNVYKFATYGGNEWKWGSSGSNRNSQEIIYYYITEWDILASTIDIYSDDTLNMSFFQKTPLSNMLTKELTVVGMMTSQDMSQMSMMELIGLVPLVVGLVILVIALKKGWKFLLTRLKAA